jgi:HPt (histidine-containing phosphotransfer) domain-containing protein
MQTPFQHINPRGLIDAVGGDRAAFDHLVGMFLRSTPASRDSLQAALAADEREPARRLAHQLKGNVVIFGATELAGALTALEQSLHAGPAPAVQANYCLALIDAVLDEMRAALEHGGD